MFQAFCYAEIITYNSPLSHPEHYVSRFVLSKNKDGKLVSDLNARISQHSDHATNFYYWTGSSADSYSFRRHIKLLTLISSVSQQTLRKECARKFSKW